MVSRFSILIAHSGKSGVVVVVESSEKSIALIFFSFDVEAGILVIRFLFLLVPGAVGSSCLLDDWVVGDEMLMD